MLASLDRLRGRFPTRRLTLEIHESAIADMSSLQALRSDLRQLDIGIAFDDFGTGQARLLELTDVSPEFVSSTVPGSRTCTGRPGGGSSWCRP